MKTCSRCADTKPFSEFSVNPRYRDGHASYCRQCQSYYGRARRFGMTPEQLDELHGRQGGRCASCQDEVPRHGKLGHVDHDHATGKVRGFLCSRCNKALGMLRDDPVRIRGLLAYLQASYR